MDSFPLQRMTTTPRAYYEDPPRSQSTGRTTRYLNDPDRPDHGTQVIPLVTDEIPDPWPETK